MIPTMRLRFVERNSYVPVAAYNAYGDCGTVSELKKFRVLQQWFEPVEVTHNQDIPDFSVKGEWRDVQLEQE